jgi:hypothetical protein
VAPMRYLKWDGLLASLCSHSSSDMPSASANRGYAAAVTITMIETQLAAALSDYQRN